MPNPVSASRAAASIALRVLQAVLGEVAKDGKVSLDDIARAVELIERGTVELDRAYAAARERCDVEETGGAELADQDGDEDEPQAMRGMRNEPLNRLLVKPFESMFFEVPPSFERKFLPAYFEAARQLIGNDFAGYDKECRVIIQSLLESHGNQLTWDMVYADPRTASLTRRTIGALAGRTHGARGEARWQQLMIKPAADGTLPTKEQVAAVRELLLTFFAKSSAAAE